MSVNICRICLHTEKTLKTSISLLTEYHDELSDFIVDTDKPLFCFECEHQLKKHYNFRNKCRRAAIILQEWEQNNLGDEKTPLKSLHNLLLCTSRLGFSNAENTRVILSLHNENKEPTPTLLISQGVILSTGSTENNKSDNIQDSAQQTNHVIPNNIAKRNQTKQLHCKDITYTTLTPDNNKKDQENGTEINTHDDIDVNYLPGFEDSRLPIISDDENDTDDLINPETVTAVSLDHDYGKNVNIPSRKRNHKAIEEPISTKDDGQQEKLEMNGMIEKEQTKISKENEELNKISPKKKAGKEQINYLIVYDPTVKKPSFRTIVNKTIRKDKLTYDAERLKAELTIKFASCGDLVTSDGTTIDKDFILDCLYRKMRESSMKAMWSMIRGKSKFNARIIQMLAFIQKKYKRLDKYKDVFDIEYLNTMDKLKEEFEKRKHYEVFVKAQYKCLVCFQNCVSEKHLEKHAIHHEESSGEVVCEVCQYRLPTTTSLKRHFLVHHQAVYKCKMCPYVGHKVENVDVHWRKHKNMIVACEICKKTGSRSTLRKHIRLYHSTTKSICNQCGNAYNPLWFASHLLKSHGIRGGVNPPIEGPGVPCDVCNVTFPSQSVYEDHINYVRHGVVDDVSGEQKPWQRRPRRLKSKTSDNSSSNNKNKSHREGKRVLGSNWEWTCPVCSARGKTWGKLKVHFEFEHPDVDMSTVYGKNTTHLCEICGRELSTIFSLRDHMRMHTGERPFQCDLCQKRYPRRSALHIHRLSHFPKSKQCPHCGKLFMQDNYLNNHLRIHVNDRRYKCKVCNKGFLYGCALTQHFNSVHLHIRRVKKSAKKVQPVDESQIIEEVIYLEEDSLTHYSE